MTISSTPIASNSSSSGKNIDFKKAQNNKKLDKNLTSSPKKKLNRRRNNYLRRGRYFRKKIQSSNQDISDVTRIAELDDVIVIDDDDDEDDVENDDNEQDNETPVNDILNRISITNISDTTWEESNISSGNIIDVSKNDSVGKKEQNNSTTNGGHELKNTINDTIIDNKNPENILENNKEFNNNEKLTNGYSKSNIVDDEIATKKNENMLLTELSETILSDELELSIQPISCDETIICLDDDDDSVKINSIIGSSLRRISPDFDKSIIYVGETIDLDKFKPSTSTKALDFIPLSTTTMNPRKREKLAEIEQYSKKMKYSPLTKRIGGDLFTASEHKKMLSYNTNAYNPNKELDDQKPKTGKRMVLIDGSNVAYQHALNRTFSVKGLQICLEYFEKMGHDVKAIVPQYRLQKFKSTEPEKLEQLHRAGKIVFTPCKNLPGKCTTSYDDRFLLQLASELDAAIVSNDNYRDLFNENPAFKKIIENRVIGYTWCNDLFILPKDPYGRLGPTLSTILNRI